MTLIDYPRGMPSKEEVVEALRGVEDPELGMDIVELGLFYDAESEGDNGKVQYTPTSTGCPAAQRIQGSGVEVVRKDGRGPDEDAVFQDRGLVHPGVVVHLAPVAHADPSPPPPLSGVCSPPP